MPSDEEAYAGGFLVRSTRGEFENVGYIGGDGMTLSCDGDELVKFNRKLLAMPTCGTFTFKPEMSRKLAGMLFGNVFRKLFGHGPRHTVTMMRRERKGHPRCRARRHNK